MFGGGGVGYLCEVFDGGGVWVGKGNGRWGGGGGVGGMV